jgi:hypothetical protein
MPRVSSVATLLALAASAVLWAAPAQAQVGRGSLETDRRPGVFGAQLVVRSADTGAVVFRLWTRGGTTAPGAYGVAAVCPISAPRSTAASLTLAVSPPS